MNDKHDMPDINGRLARYFRDIGHTMRGISEGRGSQKRILMVVQKAGAITQSELTERLGIQYGSASEVIGKLEAAGLITRTPSEADRRTTDIRLTAEGETAAIEAANERSQRHAQMFTFLSDAEKVTLAELLEKVSTAWERQYGKHTPPHRRGRGHHAENERRD